MNKNKFDQEELCLKTTQVVDSLRTLLFENESFSDFKVWDRRLKNLKHDINKIYWEL